MPKVFQTPDDSGDKVELVGAGVIQPHASGPGILIDEASLVMSELQEKNRDGSLKLDDDGNPIPLTGSDLTDAAKSFADLVGLKVVDISAKKREEARESLGIPADRPPAAEVAELEYAATYAVEPVNDDPEEAQEDRTGQPSPPPSAAGQNVNTNDPKGEVA